MLNETRWSESKFCLINNELTVNKYGDEAFSPDLWIITEIIAKMYSKHLPVYARGDLLDLGCGMCPLYSLYRKYTSSIFCIDWQGSLYPNSYADLLCDLNQPINSLENASFDTVILSDVLEHISKPEILIKEIHRLLRSNGVLLLNVPFMHWIHESPHDFYRYTEFTLRKYLNDVRLEIEVLEIVGGAIESWCYLTSRLSSYVPIVKSFLPLSLYYLSRSITSFKVINEKLNTLNSIFPLGYFIVARKTDNNYL
jgi:SAM-dependent methyltransferase